MTIITPASPADLPAILDLLTQHGLPHDGLADHIAGTLVAREGDTIIGSAALEHYGEAALLRSVAVAPTLRGQGIGGQLTAAALDLARRLGVHQLYLLTTTAEGYFPRFGFHAITRAEVAHAVQVSDEFTGACPTSAAVMALRLT